MKPYVLSILPPTSSSLVLTQSTHQSPLARIQVRSAISLSNVQILPFPFGSASDAPPPPQATALRLLTASPGAKSPACLVTTPTDKTVAAAEGSTIWLFEMQSWGEQVDELVAQGHYSDALALLDTIEQTQLTDKVCLNQLPRITSIH